MKSYVSFYHWYNKSAIRIVRLCFLAILMLLLSLGIARGEWSPIPLFFLSWYIMFSLFFHFKIAAKQPELLLLENKENVYKSFTLPALDAVLFQATTSQIIQHLYTLPAIQFILHKSNIAVSELPRIDFLKDELVKEAVTLTQNSKGTYITTVDLFAAYILLTEVKTKLLFSKNLKEEAFMHIVYWAHTAFPQEEHPRKMEVKFSGEGLAEEWVSGWTFETKKYISDLTAQVMSQNSVMIGREKEYTQAVEILSKDVKNSLILVGEPGVGKTTLVHSIVSHSFAGDLPGNLYHKRFYELMVGALLAGAQDQSALESRLQEIFAELTHAGNIILFIPEIQNITGASTFKLDLTGAFLPYLQTGAIRIIATTTPGSYKNFIEPSVSFKDVFEVISLGEPTDEEVVPMVMTKAAAIESLHHLSFTYNAIISAITLSKRYLHDQALPGTAVDLLNFVASGAVHTNTAIIDSQQVIQKVEEQTHIAVAAPNDQEKELLLHFEDKLHERVISQDEAVRDISQAVRRFRSGLSVGVKPISFLFLGPTGVGKTETAKAVSTLYFGGEQNMIRLDMSEYQTPDSIKRLLGASAGEGNERGELTEKIHEHPYSLVLLDEFEKAHPDILNLFLQVLDDGRLTDNKGKTVSFSSALIIATSNAGAEYIREAIEKGTAIDKSFHEQLLDYLQTKALFKPELLNRFDGIIVFKPIDQSQALSISKLMLAEFAKKLDEQDVAVTFDDKLLAKVSKEGFDPQFGARPLRRFIQENIEDFFARKLLEGTVKRGDKITLSVDDGGNIVITPSVSNH
ncbi:MAG TPA: ATP-dependent Clp protease ATP-binding subunit [Candidatus Saccharimonadales bacterium]|nr:ATP-dependent Clp protease ATP-binding subunit [Candidatus Saccharimonadales bacterium]